MGRYDDQLRRLAEEMEKKQMLREQLKALEERQSELELQVQALGRRKIEEQADVERLDGRGLKPLYYRISGRMEEVRALEQAEADTAAAAHEAAERELSALEERVRKLRCEMSALRGCEERYEQVLSEKKEAVLLRGGPEAGEIERLRSAVAQMDVQKEEIREAVRAGHSAQRTAEAIYAELEDADGFATWDMLGGGLIANLAKHRRLDSAQNLTMQLQAELRRFQTELADVKISMDAQMNVDGFLRFADYFFDGLFADWSVKDRIGQSKGDVQRVGRQIHEALRRLEELARANERSREDAVRQIRELVLRAEVR